MLQIWNVDRLCSFCCLVAFKVQLNPCNDTGVAHTLCLERHRQLLESLYETDRVEVAGLLIKAVLESQQ